ncbi:hypothetical protein M407DRAFT_84169 [Tulasnella calospora MUT 4182]|uniref:Mitochondrial carrier n=1 Tax=Tulasnella calospora MUT 4182 TaxID=1051891 RepID=A0A0C3PTX1_9AGAM|nr:hypothetical protein M407DRAFT_84169 [Tulasnella calospora MUT 4182]
MTTVSKTPPPGTPLTPNFTFRDYSIFFLAGAICATATHGAATPIDVVKTRVQIDPALAKHSLLQGGRKIVAAEGPRALLTGFGPTAVGYFIQGEGGLREMYAGFLPILCKQIPYALGQFTVHEYCNEIAYRNMSEETKRNLSHLQRNGISLGSGVVAGVAAAVLSQPADTLLSQINKGHGPEGSMAYRLITLGRQAGFKGLFSGLGPRIYMTAFLVSGQFAIYGQVKHALHAPPGIEIFKE